MNKLTYFFEAKAANPYSMACLSSLTTKGRPGLFENDIPMPAFGIDPDQGAGPFSSADYLRCTDAEIYTARRCDVNLPRPPGTARSGALFAAFSPLPAMSPDDSATGGIASLAL